MIGIQLQAMKEAALSSLEMTMYAGADPRDMRLRLVRQSEDMLDLLREMDRLRAVEDDLHGVLGEKTELLETVKADWDYAIEQAEWSMAGLLIKQVDALQKEIAVLKEVIDG